MKDVDDIISSHLKPEHEILDNLEILIPCDVNNPLLGLKGAAYVYGPQKGANFEDLEFFDK